MIGIMNRRRAFTLALLLSAACWPPSLAKAKLITYSA